MIRRLTPTAGFVAAFFIAGSVNSQTAHSVSPAESSALSSGGQIQSHGFEELEKRELDRRLTFATEVLAGSTTLLFAFTALLWWVTYRLSRDARDASRRQSADMEASIATSNRSAVAMEEVASATKNNAISMQGVLHKQMRAYISVHVADAYFQDNNLQFEAIPAIENTGLTAARNVSYRVMADVLPTNLAPNFHFEEPLLETRNDASIAPRHRFNIGGGMVKTIFGADDVIEIKRGVDKRLFVWGVVTYDDVFDGRGWATNFCMSCTFSIAPNGSTRFNYFYHPTHNAST